MPVTGGAAGVTQKALRILLCATAVVLLFSLYTWGISENPPGFYLDESGAAYNAYLVSPNWSRRIRPAVSSPLRNLFSE